MIGKRSVAVRMKSGEVLYDDRIREQGPLHTSYTALIERLRLQNKQDQIAAYGFVGMFGGFSDSLPGDAGE